MTAIFLMRCLTDGNNTTLPPLLLLYFRHHKKQDQTTLVLIRFQLSLDLSEAWGLMVFAFVSVMQNSGLEL